MIIDITGIELIPGNHGKDCPGNGENGNECCCDENYTLKLEKIEELKERLSHSE